VEAGGVTADVFCCEEHPEDGRSPYGVLIIKWGSGSNGDQHDTECLARGIPHGLDETWCECCVGELDDVPLKDLWAQALLLVVRDARAYRQGLTDAS